MSLQPNPNRSGGPRHGTSTEKSQWLPELHAASGARSPEHSPPRIDGRDLRRDEGRRERHRRRIDGADPAACDVSDEAQVAELFTGALSRHGRVDIAVPTPASAAWARSPNSSLQDWRKMMAVNLDGVFQTVKHAARAMVGAGNGGSIITMASVTGLAGTPLCGHYAAAKAGVINLTKTAALELRPASVRENAICPGFADTDLVSAQKGVYEQALGLPSFDALIEQAQGGYVTLDDIARLTVFLASERSRFCTGGAYRGRRWPHRIAAVTVNIPRMSSIEGPTVERS